MTKSEIIEALADAEGITLKAAEVVVNATFNRMAEALSNFDRIEIRGFGSFRVNEIRFVPSYISRPEKIFLEYSGKIR